MPRFHHYAVTVEWIGDTGCGTASHETYHRTYRLRARGKPEITGSADPAFGGSAEQWNPEDLLVAALSACHKLWYLHLCAEAGITVTSYRDDATGIMKESRSGGHFQDVFLQPQVNITQKQDLEEAERLHQKASERCFIRSSVNFHVHHQAKVTVDESTPINDPDTSF